MNTLLSRMLCIIMAVCLLTALPLAAVSGTWIGGSGNWSDPNNWQGGIIADGANDIATFSPSDNIHVTVDTARTIGHIRNTGSAQLHIYGPATLTLQDSTKPTITNSSTGSTFLKVPLAGTAAFAKYGTPRVVMWKDLNHTMSGAIRINQGELRFDSAGATIPAVATVRADFSDAAARLHFVSPTDPMSVYPCTFQISGYGLQNGSPPSLNNIGSLFLFGGGVEAAVSNITMNTGVANIARIGQGGGGSGKIEFRGVISGISAVSPQFFVNQGNKTNDFIGSNTYAAAGTYFSMADSASHGVFIFRGPQRLPKTQLDCHVNNGSITLDLLNNKQEFTKIVPSGGGTLYVKSTGGGGQLYLSGDVNNFAYEPYNGTKLLATDGVQILIDEYMLVWQGCEVVVSNNAILVCGLEILTGWGGSGNIVTVADGGIINNNVFRASESGDGTLNLMPGGTLQTSAIHNGSDVETGTINFNGGKLSDGTWGQWNGSYANWLQGNNLVVNILPGGAFIEVNNVNGRTIQRVLQGSGNLVKLGPQTLTLTANNTYSGNTIVSNGTLKVTTQAAIPAASPIIDVISGASLDVASVGGFAILANQTLKGNGSISGDLLLQNGSTLAPGASVGSLTINGDVTTQNGSLYEWEKAPGAGNTDKIVVNGDLYIQNATTVKVIPLGGATPGGHGVTDIVFQVSGSVSGIGNLQLDLTSAPGFSGYFVNTGNGVGLVLVPEPAAALLLGALAFLALRRRS